jgi:hypothetical protein
MPREPEPRRYSLTGGRGDDQLGGPRPSPKLENAAPNRLFDTAPWSNG